MSYHRTTKQPFFVTGVWTAHQTDNDTREALFRAELMAGEDFTEGYIVYILWVGVGCTVEP